MSEAMAMQFPVCGPRIVEYLVLENVSNIKDMDNDAVTTTLPQEPIDHESQIFVRTCNRTIVLNVNLASDSVEGVKRIIEQREGIPVTEQHLNFGGKPLRHGTFLRDYDALGHQCTLNVFARIPGGNRTTDSTLSILMGEAAPRPEQPIPPSWNIRADRVIIRRNQSIPLKTGHEDVLVLTEVGGRIVHGVLTCILSAHRAGLSFNGEFGTDKLCVHGYTGATGEVVVSRVYVNDEIQPMPPLDNPRQNADYRALRQVIKALFPGEDWKETLHVGRICKLLDILAAGDDDDDGTTRRTHLLQAYAAIVSSPVAVSSMCLNLKRFYDQLDSDGDQRRSFDEAMVNARYDFQILLDQAKQQPMFEKVLRYDYNQYAEYGTGMVLLHFARNWFTHVPPELRCRNRTQAQFTGLPELDYIFTHHFPDFILNALFHLYKKFDDPNLLTKILVPLA